MNCRTGLAAASLLALAACASTCPPTAPAAPAEVVTKTRVVDTGCDWTRPIYLDKSDVLSDATAAMVLAHNKAGAKNCGWKPLK
ncbi:hypothetical protein [Paraburkholderia caballeronis]|uniref:hypothetical protein n=1 Tax=Paraburkholderia caballeronis TaxID=416943 RepID=UPI0010664B5E|nr:hypothetical protein [Paraburkholderia caballeronis]TDV06077.1 hypothetical protein C7408_12458 [Paraburkholderia caballeronis]TDV09617.1 hypothetical protein C7406_12658 [Paraburkholderia caballeronis]TDV21682.1 hypothetical protein C7404_12158 [Paraburkholderia caballeronis]